LIICSKGGIRLADEACTYIAHQLSQNLSISEDEVTELTIMAAFLNSFHGESSQKSDIILKLQEIDS
jgi:hypothetical protein